MDFEGVGDIGNKGERKVATENDWGFYAHLSVYRLFANYVGDATILEIGSGTGYGANYLSGVARRIVSLDVSPDATAYCRAHAASDAIDFRLHDMSESIPDGAPFDCIITSNALEHVPAIDRMLENCARALKPGGRMLIAVPPVISPGAFAEHFRNPFHVNNLTPFNWLTKLSRFFHEVRPFRHWVTPDLVGSDGMPIEMGLPPGETRVREGDFTFEELKPDEVKTCQHTICSLFVATGPRESVGAPSLDEELPRDWHVGKLCATVMLEEIGKKDVELAYYKGEFERVSRYAQDVTKNAAEEKKRIEDYYANALSALESAKESEAQAFRAELKKLDAYARDQVASVVSLSAELHAATEAISELKAKTLLQHIIDWARGGTGGSNR